MSSKRLVSADDQAKTVIAKYRTGHRVPDFELLKALGLFVRNHELTCDDPTDTKYDYDPVAVPKALLYAVGTALVARRRQTRQHNAKRSLVAHDKRAELVEIASRIAREHPSLKIPELARQARGQFLRRNPKKRCPALRRIVLDLKAHFVLPIENARILRSRR
jgi:hypothetical protein